MARNLTKRPTVRLMRRCACVVFGAAVAIYFYYGLRPDPRFKVASLRGLTTAQVITRLGQPRIDGRAPAWGAWTPAKEPDLGPLKFYYYEKYGWKGYEYAIIFKNDKVVDVKIGTK
jgi:hypothetical protein